MSHDGGGPGLLIARWIADVRQATLELTSATSGGTDAPVPFPTS